MNGGGDFADDARATALAATRPDGLRILDSVVVQLPAAHLDCGPFGGRREPVTLMGTLLTIAGRD